MKRLTLALVSGAMLTLTAPAFASGSMGGGAQSAQLGQRVYMQKIACSGCPFAGGLKSREQVNAALAKIESGEIRMSGAEKKAVTAFISRRFKGL